MTKPTVIALHGDLATPAMLQRDVGDFAQSVDIFFDARGWLRFDAAMGRLTALVQSLPVPPIVVGYSRGGSAIARLSELVPLTAAVLYESPVLDSEGTGGNFPCLMIWNDQGAAYGPSKLRRGQARISKEIWRADHLVKEIEGQGRHMRIRPAGHCWDCDLNNHIKTWIESCTNTTAQS